MNRTRRSLVSISVVALSALVLAGCGGDQEAGSDRSVRRQAALGVLDARICLVNFSGDALEVSFRRVNQAKADAPPPEPLGRDELCGPGVSYKGLAEVQDESGDPTFAIYWTNDIVGKPFVSVYPDSGDGRLCRSSDRLAEGGAFVMEPYSGKPCDEPYRLEMLRRPDSTDAKELLVAIYR